MKKTNILFSTFCSVMLGMGFTGCADEFDEIGKYPYDDTKNQGFYILNEGIWGANNANIMEFVTINNEEIHAQGDVYLKRNKKQLGDVGNAMMKEDDKIYVVLNGSKYVGKLNLNGTEEARYTFPKDEGEPRCIDVEGDYVYVTQYGGQVTKLNVKDMTLAGTFKGGGNLEGIVEKDGKLYVSNSYMVDGSYNYVYGNEVFVIDAQTMKKEASIPVIVNPAKIYNIDDKIYLISQGNYDGVPMTLQLIDPKTNTSKVITSDATKITKGHNGLIYGIRATYDENWQPSNSFFIYNPKADEVSETSFLKDASFKHDDIWLFEVDEETGYIYVSTSNYTTNGTVYQFDKNGKLLRQFDSGGINPSTMVFID